MDGKGSTASCQLTGYDLAQHQKRAVEILNATQGSLAGYDCSRCKNRGYWFRQGEDGEPVRVDCSCMEIRKSLRRGAASGLGELLKRCTFAAFQAAEPWQARLKEAARAWAQNPVGWFVAAGASGAGKTHLCTAICGELLRRGRAVTYRTWRETARQIKGAALDGEERRRWMEPLVQADVLYLDDFLKTAAGRAPTPADVELAFDILNPRYNRKALTILSTELFQGDILSLDGALGSRVYEMTGGGQRFVEIGAQPGRNYRLRQRDERSFFA